ncbi:Oligomycin resistance ATP-dependent permease YOR1 [Diaporthe amygdali]|uniref:Oligomycin resistance ATP-dependent permease YOR1 n=1 Tax=Phomopsis amygdali TaxID=1214568 RepID=UPI0022FF0CAC|nr:Oligomycin resistance ATP-dependent permease YOR1 [Diaporthe amygdali]KAJ0124872.1 Oligomycin resistance ATP-dependent permease YOR1 [Diaporthe amygdali]
MASNVTGTSAFPPRKWYRKVPFVSTTPIERRLTEPVSKSSSKSTPRDVEDGARDGAETGAGRNPKAKLPESTANWFSILLFQWLSPVLRIGYTRPLQTDDLYDMPDHRQAEDHADKLERCWAARLEKNRSKPAESGPWTPFWMRRRSDTTVLTMALNDVCFRWFWLGGMFKLAGDLTQMISPLLIRFTISYLSDSSLHATRAGFGLVVGLFLVLVFSVTANVHGFYRSYTTGVLLRGALMHTIYRRATSDQLTERAKLRNGYTGVGKLMSLMSADVTRVDFVCGYFHSAWTSILQMLLCLALTIWTMGYSALPGFGLLALLYPLQTFMVGKLLKLRRGSMPFTDARVKAVVEAVSAIRLVKTNAYEKSLLAKIGHLRGDEVVYIRKRMLLRALNTAVSYTAPTIAAVLAIVCYGATQGGLKADVIFSSLTFFMLLRTPLQALPTSLSAIADARAALERLTAFMIASDAGAPIPPKFVGGSTSEQLDGDKPVQTVVVVEDATFAYHDDETLLDDSSETSTQNTTATAMEKIQDEKQQDGSQSQVMTTPIESQSHQSQRLHIESLIVERDQLVCVVGPVASGKSSIFRALMGDMQPVQARNCQVNTPSLAYAPQTAWLLSETVRENIVFGRPFDQAWYQQVLTRCCLHRDLERLPEGDMTVVGEMGVSLSGGQKQRISLARAIYGRSPLLFLDDCFSALDADVGKQVFEMVVNQARRNKEATVVLVTHSMVLASQADRVVYMEKGRIVEQGEYAVLSRRDGPFSRFVGTSMDSWSAAQEEEAYEERQAGETNQASQSPESTPGEKELKNNDNKEKKPEASGRGKEIMQKEERLVGSVSGKTYLRYVMMGNAYVTVPLFVTSIIIYQGTSIVSPLWLTWWEESKYSSITESEYMGGYAAFGVGQSLGLFCMSASFALFCFYCSNRLHHASIARVLHAPVAFFDTTPQGRITHRFSKDVDAVDNVVGETLRLFISTSVQAIGTIILVTIILPPFIAIAAVLLLAYTWTGMYYRPSARELRRLNNLLRSRIYEHFGESLSGLATLKAFGAVSRFVQDNARRIDTENTAYWLSVACQRWLNLRLDLCGAVLVFITGLLVVGLRGTISASAGGVVLSYVVTAQSVFGNMIRQSAEIENNMNSVERMLHYAYNIEQEPPYEAEGVDKELKAKGWPHAGRVEFRELTLSHRPGLPPALRNVTLDIKPGEKVGIVGRTGAGKTTLISALLRNTEPTSGKIVIDGVDIHTIGLSLLRSSLSVISQDAVLLAGTIRYNLDPFQQYDDAWLHKCLSRVKLADSDQPANTEEIANTSEDSTILPDTGNNSELEKQETEHSRRGTGGLSLDFEVKEGGANISQGQRSLISIARALVRSSKIVIMDEATASIDGRADAQLQEMLNEVLGDATVLTVAHRLDTIVATCDRVVVMESGQVAEFDGIPELFAQKDSIFRSLCDASKITVGGARR